MLLEVPHHAGRGVETEGAASREDDGVDLLDRVDRVEQVGLARAGGRAPHIHAADRSLPGQDDSTAGRPAGHFRVADLEARDRGETGRRRCLGAWVVVHGNGGEKCRNQREGQELVTHWGLAVRFD